MKKKIVYKPVCANCLFCEHTNNGAECKITDNSVEYNQEACIDYIASDETTV